MGAAVAQEINLAWGVKDDLQKLQRTLQVIAAVIADAENRQEMEELVRFWLVRLKDVAYDADDVMDEFSYETIRRGERGDRVKDKVRDFVSSSNPLVFRFKMANKIKDVNRSLDEITKDMARFQLQTTSPSNTINAHGGSSEQQSRQTTSLVNESKIIGREDDKKEIIRLLTTLTASSSSGSYNTHHENISVVSIVGMGGVGKTTLAQFVYKDKLVENHFDQRIWVFVSKDFDVKTILIKIMESITEAKFENLSNLDVLVNEVQKKLKGKKYLLVLDDVWNDRYEQWEDLKTPLLVGAQGSKILITTRENQVADVVNGSIPSYRLENLQEDECWSIMENEAFSPGGALKTPNMTNIGKEISKKCGGLPLAAKILGSLMRLKNNEGDWLSIKENSILDTPEGQSRIMPILKLSYDNLTSQLRQCFSYCSIFPKGLEINRETLIQLWNAEGFLESSNVGSKKSREDIGNEYFVSLVRSSFLDVKEMNDLDDIRSCTMHDLVHDLAQSVVGNHECAIVSVSELMNIPRVRRLQLIVDEALSAAFSVTINSAKKLRTLIILDSPYYELDPNRFSKSKRLRVLYLDSLTKALSPLSSWSPKLKHLRYLNLSSFDLSETPNHNSINKLYNLQTLVLCECRHVQDFLKNIESLKKLRHLNITLTDIKELPDSVTSLCNLQRLDLQKCNSFTSFPNSINGLEYLRFLDLSFTPIEELPDSITSLHHLQTLDINSCQKLKALPKYVKGLEELRIFNFRDCTLLEALPEDFGLLTQLRSLDLFGTKIKVLLESCANLNNLEFVDLSFCELPKEVTNWKKLKYFIYGKEGAPVGIGELVYLRELSYSVNSNTDLNAGIEELRNLNLLEEITIYDLENVEDPVDAEEANLKGKEKLRRLYLEWGEKGFDHLYCSRSSLVLEALQPHTNLKTFSIHNFMGWDLPTWMHVSGGLPNLEFLEIFNCKRTEQLPEAIGQLPRLKSLHLSDVSLNYLGMGFPSLVELHLTDMSYLQELCFSYPCLRDLRITGCRSLTKIPSFPCLEFLLLKEVDHSLVSSVGISQTSITTLFLHNVEELIYFPLNILRRNCNLQILQIRECNQFQGFRVNDNQKKAASFLFGSELDCVCLQRLDLIDCPDLKFLPDLQRWTSLWILFIWNCPNLRNYSTYDLKSLSSLKELYVDYVQRDEQRGDPSVHAELVNLIN